MRKSGALRRFKTVFLPIPYVTGTLFMERQGFYLISFPFLMVCEAQTLKNLLISGVFRCVKISAHTVSLTIEKNTFHNLI